MLKVLIFVFDRPLDPVFAVEVDSYSTLVKAVLGGIEVSFDDERKVLFSGCGLQNGGVVVAEVVVGSLPEVCAGFGGDFNSVGGDGIALGVGASR